MLDASIVQAQLRATYPAYSEKLKKTTKALLMSAQAQIVFPVGLNGETTMIDLVDALCESIAIESINEMCTLVSLLYTDIKLNSELVPITTDMGPTGSGIITGKVG